MQGIGTPEQLQELKNFVRTTKKRDDQAEMKQPPKVVLDIDAEIVTDNPKVLAVTATMAGWCPALATLYETGRALSHLSLCCLVFVSVLCRTRSGPGAALPRVATLIPNVCCRVPCTRQAWGQ